MTANEPGTTAQHVATAVDPDLVDRLAHPSDAEVEAMDAWWRANNYLTVGQIYLMGNPLLREPLDSDQVKPRLLGHWAPAPGSRSSTRTRPA